MEQGLASPLAPKEGSGENSASASSVSPGGKNPEEVKIRGELTAPASQECKLGGPLQGRPRAGGASGGLTRPSWESAQAGWLGEGLRAQQAGPVSVCNRRGLALTRALLGAQLTHNPLLHMDDGLLWGVSECG